VLQPERPKPAPPRNATAALARINLPNTKEEVIAISVEWWPHNLGARQQLSSFRQ
jgi:hypothetical protein